MSDPQCSWCQYSNTYASSDKTTTSTVSLGRCLSSSLCDKCRGETSAAGYAGTCVPTKPTECTSDSTSDNIKDPATGITDPAIKAMMTKVVDGSVTSLDIQKKTY
jgi:hypothetical protein